MAKYRGKGVILEREDAAGGGTFTAVPQVQDLDFNEEASDELDVTTHDDAGKDFLPGDKDYGTVSVTVIWDGANAVHNNIISDHEASDGGKREWRITFAGDARKFSYQGHVQTLTWATPQDGAKTMTFGLRLSSPADHDV